MQHWMDVIPKTTEDLYLALLTIETRTAWQGVEMLDDDGSLRIKLMTVIYTDIADGHS